MPLRHDVEEGLEGGDGPFDAAIPDVVLGDLLLSLHDILNAINEFIHALEFRPKHILIEHDLGVVKEPAQVGAEEILVDPISQAAGQMVSPL